MKWPLPTARWLTRAATALRSLPSSADEAAAHHRACGRARRGRRRRRRRRAGGGGRRRGEAAGGVQRGMFNRVANMGDSLRTNGPDHPMFRVHQAGIGAAGSLGGAVGSRLAVRQSKHGRSFRRTALIAWPVFWGEIRRTRVAESGPLGIGPPFLQGPPDGPSLCILMHDAYAFMHHCLCIPHAFYACITSHPPSAGPTRS